VEQCNLHCQEVQRRVSQLKINERGRKEEPREEKKHWPDWDVVDVGRFRLPRKLKEVYQGKKGRKGRKEKSTAIPKGNESNTKPISADERGKRGRGRRALLVFEGARSEDRGGEHP